MKNRYLRFKKTNLLIRYKKIRGHTKIWKEIEVWIETNKTLDIDNLQLSKRDYVKVWVAPFSNISVLNSEFPAPRRKTRQKIVNGIFEIYTHWKQQLETLDKPYYLKVWYFPHNVSMCQVVCAIDDFVNFYDSTFYTPEVNKPFPEQSSFGLNWEYKHQEHHVTIDDIGEPEEFYSEKEFLDNKKHIESVIKIVNTRISTYKNKNKTTTYYSIKECNVWIGG